MNTTKQKPSISGSVLKLIAMATMLTDHTAVYILSCFEACTAPFLTVLGKQISVFWICRIIGRVSFPIYCFLLVQGFMHTKNRLNYGVRLLVFALISELPWDFARTGRLLYFSSQNVMFTLLFGYITLCALEQFKDSIPKQIIAVLISALACGYGNVDYKTAGLGLILVFYLVQNSPVAQALLGACMLGKISPIAAFIPINLYNGERGFIKGRLAKYSAYIFYPAHLALLGLLRHYLFLKL